MNTLPKFPHESVTQPMKKALHPSLVLAALCAALLLVPASRAADANPPGKLTYQGFLTDINGVPLGNTAPVNTSVIFRIYSHATSTATADLKWSEQQVVTVDKGHFSVLLGEGSAVSGEAGFFNANLSTVFSGVDASDRFMQITVGSTVIAPRLQFLPAPYAHLARKAMTVDSTASLLPAQIIGTFVASQIPVLDAGKITTGALDAARIPVLDASKITTGTVPGAALANAVLKAGGNTISDAQALTGNVTLGTAGTTTTLTVKGTVSAFQTAVTKLAPINVANGYSTNGIAETDGFLSARITWIGGNVVADIKGFVGTDAQITGGTAPQLGGASAVNFNVVDNTTTDGSFMMPVLKGKTWKVTLTRYAHTGTLNIAIYWTPFGQP